MNTSETIDEFYERKVGAEALRWVPDTLKNEIGHFTIFPLEPTEPDKPKSLPYKRRDYYKIMLVLGNIDMHYADRVITIDGQSLVFSNPQIPYKCDRLDQITGGFYCIFNPHFFHRFGNLTQYSVFQPNGDHVFDLSDEQVLYVSSIYKKMFDEIDSDYIHKYDVLRNLVFELLHIAMKMQPSTKFDTQPINASQRIASLFLELLERQFPIDENHPGIALRSASDFASQLNVHVNHLNRAVKGTTRKTTSQLIAERVLQEAKIMLRHSAWGISEIAYALGFNEVTHFNNFFKKHVQLSPSKFRQG
ncbi:helix-turn-helix domain-containing protein [Fibrella arboris]|uniref:helix-turn-helix domain-containing protein n=1 Tax=Fibrella arboris TaxID=3242486 RepID=UPI003521F3F6